MVFRLPPTWLKSDPESHLKVTFDLQSDPKVAWSGGEVTFGVSLGKSLFGHFWIFGVRVSRGCFGRGAFTPETGAKVDLPHVTLPWQTAGIAQAECTFIPEKKRLKAHLPKLPFYKTTLLWHLERFFPISMRHFANGNLAVQTCQTYKLGAHLKARFPDPQFPKIAETSETLF